MTATEAPQHPGVVTFVDADSFAEYQVEVDNLPWEVAWADTDAGAVPVTRIVGRRRDGLFQVESYGADGVLLHVVSRPTGAEDLPPEGYDGAEAHGAGAGDAE